MPKRVASSMGTQESPSDLIEGGLSSADGWAAVVKLLKRLIVEEILETETRNVAGRDHYQLAVVPRLRLARRRAQPDRPVGTSNVLH